MGESAEDVKREEEIVKVSNILTAHKKLKNIRRKRGPPDPNFFMIADFMALPLGLCQCALCIMLLAVMDHIYKIQPYEY